MKIPVMITIETDSIVRAEEVVDHIFRTAANNLVEYEPATFKAFVNWQFMPRNGSDR